MGGLGRRLLIMRSSPPSSSGGRRGPTKGPLFPLASAGRNSLGMCP